MHEHNFKFYGKGAEYFGIWIVNVLFTILTLGIYSAWAKVRTLRYFHGNVEVDGERFDYLATPKQILIGRIIAVAFLCVWILADSINPIASLIVLVTGIVLYPAVAVRGMRFNMKMTRYRNVRFDFLGSMGQGYVNFLLIPILAQVVVMAPLVLLFAGVGSGEDPEQTTSGLLVFAAIALFMVAMLFANAWVMKSITQFVVSNVRYGHLEFKTSLNAGQYVKIFLIAGLFGLLAMIVFGIVASIGAAIFGAALDITALLGAEGESPDLMAIMSNIGVYLFLGYLLLIIVMMTSQAYFIASSRNYLFQQTEISAEGIKLNPVSDLRMWPLYWVMTSNLLMIVFTVGLAYPFAKVRKVRLLTEATQLNGSMDLSDITDQVKEKENALGDEIGEAFDVDVGVI